MAEASDTTKNALKAYNQARESTKKVKSDEEKTAREALKSAEDAVIEVDDMIAQKHEKEVRETLGDDTVGELKSNAFWAKYNFDASKFKPTYDYSYLMPNTMTTTEQQNSNPTLNPNLNLNLWANTNNPTIDQAKADLGKWLLDKDTPQTTQS